MWVTTVATAGCSQVYILNRKSGVLGEAMRLVWVAAFGAALFVAGCAKDASDVRASYVSPILYENYTCPQLGEEATRISAKAGDAAGVQNQHSTNDKVAMGVGLIVFWPALLMVKGNDENAVELARLKGQMDAIEEASIKKRCGITFQHITPTPPKSGQPMPEYQASGS
ncbi:MAG TPA: hypothetical protein VG867_07735 [Rhizomicrobium sp.]|nr:hypothetical protein [Rhizomicrobium sp.]